MRVRAGAPAEEGARGAGARAAYQRDADPQRLHAHERHADREYPDQDCDSQSDGLRRRRLPLGPLPLLRLVAGH